MADAYDVITSVRSYKKHMSPEAARAELVRCSGTQFDPEVVRAFLAVGIGERKNAGFLGWLLELPTISRVGLSLTSVGSSALSVGTVAVVAVSGALSSGPDTSEGLAFVDPQEEAVVTTAPGDRPAESTVSSSISGPASVTTASTSQGGSTTTDAIGSTTSVRPETSSTGSSTTTRIEATTTVQATTSTQVQTSSEATTTSAAVTTTTAQASTTTTGVAGPLTLYLGNPGSGNTSSSPSLAMSPNSPVGSVLPNYDRTEIVKRALGWPRTGRDLATRIRPSIRNGHGHS